MNIWLVSTLLFLYRVAHGASTACKWETSAVSDDDRFSKSDESFNRLFCRLRTLQPHEWEAQIVQLAAPRLERTSTLNIECSDVLFFESALESETFRRFPRLRDLSISSCKVREIQPGALATVADLKRLSIQTHNTDWPAMALTLTADSFSGLRELRHLDLSDNSLLSTPENLFCSLSSLQSLNLSSNRLQDVSSLGFKSDCLQELTNLDMSWNAIEELFPSSMTALRKLQSLSLQHNGMVNIADHALANLEALKILNLSSNQLAVLPPDLFRDCSELRELDLHNNSLAVLPFGSFSGLIQLQVLDLSMNSLGPAAVHRDTFPGLVRLVVLNLAQNALTRLDSQMFRDLASLQVLRLEHNLIESIDPDAFLPLYNLHTLDLSYNRLTIVGDRLFGGLFVLSSLSLSHNQIMNVNNQAFRNCTGLRDLDLSGNSLVSIPEAVAELSLLKSLDLSANRISAVANISFNALQQLYSLNLADNNIKSINKDTFGGLQNLVALNLASNEIENLEPGTFDRCSGLQVLRLDDNAFVDVNGLFPGLQNLRWLNISANRIQLFDYSFLPMNLEWLDMHQNEVTELGNYFTIGQSNLQALDASFNRLTSLTSENIPDSIVELFLNNNWISKIAPNTFLKKANISRVDLNSNRLSFLEPAALWLSPVPNERDLPEFSLGDNPWECDCSLEWLPPLVQPSSQSRQQPRLVDAADITCRLTFNRRQNNETERAVVPLVDVRPEQFLCAYETHCFALCHCCDFDACDCEMTCPSGCSCYHDPTWSANIVDCSGSQHSSLPEGIPMDVTELYLDGNHLNELSSHAFIGRKNLRVLFLNASHVHTLRNRTFHGLGSLHILHLENNFLEEIRGSEFEPLEHLRELYLQNNQLRFIGDTTFTHLRSLQVLRLDGNRLLNFPMWRFAANPHLQQISLAQNPWTCDCRFLVDFHLWAQNNPERVSDLSDLRCFDRDSPRQGLQYIDFNVTCNNLVATIVARQHVAMIEYLPAMLATMILFVLVIIVLVIGFIYRESLRIWFFARYGIRLCQKECQDDSKPDMFDAFVSYSLKDEQFVTQVLAAELEHGSLCYRLCLQHRDFPTNNAGGVNHTVTAGDPLTLGLAASRRIVLVISQSFVESEWTRPEVRAALTGFLRKPQMRIIAIVLSPKPTDEADSDLCLLLKSCSIVRWGESRFWPKIRYALPNPKSRHYIQNLHSGGLWYNPSPPKAETATVTLTNKTTLSTVNNKPKSEVYWEIGNGLDHVIPRRYTSTPHTVSTPYSSWLGSNNEDHGLDESTQSIYSGRSQCYSRLEHSYMSIDHGHEHIYSSVQDPAEQQQHHHHHQQQQQQQHFFHSQHNKQNQQQHPDCWSYRSAGHNFEHEGIRNLQQHAVLHHVPGPRPPTQQPTFTLNYNNQQPNGGPVPTFLV